MAEGFKRARARAPAHAVLKTIPDTRVKKNKRKPTKSSKAGEKLLKPRNATKKTKPT